MTSMAADRKPMFIAVAHQKGGSGKTTTVCNLASCFARSPKNLRVIVIDLDPQGAASRQLGRDAEPKIGAYEFVIAGQMLKSALQPTKVRNCLLVPATQRLVMAEMDAQTRDLSYPDVQARLRKHLSNIDIVIFDCPTGFGPIATMAMAIADLIVVPTPPRQAETSALRHTVEHVERLRRNARDRIAVVTVMNDDRNALENTVAETLHREFGNVLVPIGIPRDRAVDEAMVADAPVAEFDPNAAASVAYRRLAAELGHRIGVDFGPMSEMSSPTMDARMEQARAPAPAFLSEPAEAERIADPLPAFRPADEPARAPGGALDGIQARAAERQPAAAEIEAPSKPKLRQALNEAAHAALAAQQSAPIATPAPARAPTAYPAPQSMPTYGDEPSSRTGRVRKILYGLLALLLFVGLGAAFVLGFSTSPVLVIVGVLALLVLIPDLIWRML